MTPRPSPTQAGDAPLGLVVLIAARNEGGRIGETVRAARSLPGVERVYAIENGSTDATVTEAREAGAWVLSAPGRLGKGDALEAALRRIPKARTYLFLDGDLGASAKEGSLLVAPVVEGRADLCIGVFPKDARHGGFGLVKRTSARLIRALTGVQVQEPMSGQRALSEQVLESVRPLARGFGLEVAMTIDALRLRYRVLEVPVSMEHRYTGRDAAGFAHRARQGWHILRAWLPRAMKYR